MEETPPRRRRPPPRDDGPSLPFIPIVLGVIVLGFIIGAGLSVAGRHGPAPSDVVLATASPQLEATEPPVTAAPDVTLVPRPKLTAKPKTTARPTLEPTASPEPSASAANSPAPSGAASNAAASSASASNTAAPSASGTSASTTSTQLAKQSAGEAASAAPHASAPARATTVAHGTVPPPPPPLENGAAATSRPATAAPATAAAATTAPATAAPASADDTNSDFGKLAAGVVRSFLAAVARGDTDGAYAQLGATPGTAGITLPELGIVTRATRIEHLEARGGENAVTVNVDMLTPNGAYFGQYTVHRTANGAAVIVQHAIFKS